MRNEKGSPAKARDRRLSCDSSRIIRARNWVGGDCGGVRRLVIEVGTPVAWRPSDRSRRAVFPQINRFGHLRSYNAIPALKRVETAGYSQPFPPPG